VTLVLPSDTAVSTMLLNLTFEMPQFFARIYSIFLLTLPLEQTSDSKTPATGWHAVGASCSRRLRDHATDNPNHAPTHSRRAVLLRHLNKSGAQYGREHAPCSKAGSISGIDQNYPYANGVLGSWGYDARSATLFDPAVSTDLME